MSYNNKILFDKASNFVVPCDISLNELKEPKETEKNSVEKKSAVMKGFKIQLTKVVVKSDINFLEVKLNFNDNLDTNSEPRSIENKSTAIEPSSVYLLWIQFETF